MIRETKYRSIVKTITWRILATITTFVLVYIFTGELTVAFTIGFLEVFLKMLIYFLHERAWDKINFGRKEIKPFVLWFTGLASSGKNELAEEIYRILKSKGLKTDFLEGHTVRHFFPETGFTREEVNQHIKRVGYLARKLEENGVIVVASFLSPYKKSREDVASLCTNYLEIFVDASVEYCRKRDKDGIYRDFDSGKLKYVPGLDVPYERPENPSLKLSPDTQSKKEMIDRILKLIEKKI